MMHTELLCVTPLVAGCLWLRYTLWCVLHLAVALHDGIADLLAGHAAQLVRHRTALAVKYCPTLVLQHHITPSLGLQCWDPITCLGLQ